MKLHGDFAWGHMIYIFVWGKDFILLGDRLFEKVTWCWTKAAWGWTISAWGANFDDFFAWGLAWDGFAWGCEAGMYESPRN